MENSNPTTWDSFASGAKQFLNDVVFLYVPKLIMACIVLGVGWKLINLLNRVMKRAYERHQVDPSLQEFLHSVIDIVLKVLLVPVPETLKALSRIRPTISRFTIATMPLRSAGRLIRWSSACFIHSKKFLEPINPCSSAPKKAKMMLRGERAFLKCLASWSTTASPLALSSAPG